MILGGVKQGEGPFLIGWCPARRSLVVGCPQANATRSPETLEDALAGYLPLPGFEIEDGLVRMIGADKLGRAAESLETDGILPAFLAFLAFSHDVQTFLFPALTSFSRTEFGPLPSPAQGRGRRTGERVSGNVERDRD